MIGSHRCKQIIGHELIHSPTGYLNEKEIYALWQIFTEIVKNWHDGEFVKNIPEKYYGQWYEFVVLNIRHSPSYLNEYRNGITVLEELKAMYPNDYWHKLFFDNGLNLYFNPDNDETEFDRPDRTTRLGHFKIYVIDEFIDVYLTCGGFKQYKKEGKGNYNSYIYQSRFNRVDNGT